MILPVTDKDLYETQDIVVIRLLQTENNYTMEDAARTWYNSGTRQKIQKELKLSYLGGAQCWDELTRELTDTDTWCTMFCF